MNKEVFKIKAVLDDKTCDLCRMMHGKKITDKKWLSPYYEGENPCRCIAEKILGLKK